MNTRLSCEKYYMCNLRDFFIWYVCSHLKPPVLKRRLFIHECFCLVCSHLLSRRSLKTTPVLSFCFFVSQASAEVSPPAGTKRKALASCGDDAGDADAHWSESLPPLGRTSARSPVGVEEILMEEMVQVK